MDYYGIDELNLESHGSKTQVALLAQPQLVGEEVFEELKVKQT